MSTNVEVMLAALDPRTPEVGPVVEASAPLWGVLDEPLRRVEEESVEPALFHEWASGRGPRVTRWIVVSPGTFVEIRKHGRDVLTVGCRAHSAPREETGYEVRGAEILRCGDVADGVAWIVGRTSSGFVKMGVCSR
jgi:hypothetical protein